MGCMVWGLNPGISKRIFSSPEFPDQPCSLPSLLLNKYWGSFWAVEQLGHEVNYLPPFCAKVKNE